MKYRRRIYYNAAQRSEIWDRWQRGESMSSIGRAFDRQSSSVFSVISPTGGIRPPDRRHSEQVLSVKEREEISRGLSTDLSLRRIARDLGRAPSPSAARFGRAVVAFLIAQRLRIRLLGIGLGVPRLVSWRATHS